jgi:hypothetical protein
MSPAMNGRIACVPAAAALGPSRRIQIAAAIVPADRAAPAAGRAPVS